MLSCNNVPTYLEAKTPLRILLARVRLYSPVNVQSTWLRGACDSQWHSWNCPMKLVKPGLFETNFRRFPIGRPLFETYPTLQSATSPSCVSFIVFKRFSTPSHFHKLLQTGHSNDIPSTIFSYSGNRFTISSISAKRKSYSPFPLRFLMVTQQYMDN